MASVAELYERHRQAAKQYGRYSPQAIPIWFELEEARRESRRRWAALGGTLAVALIVGVVVLTLA